jgi:membrane-associated protease RseP (regulator of RpoE activity)
MKIKSIAIIAAISLLPIAGFAQPPVSPVPPVPPVPPGPHERMPKVPMIFLGVETSTVPSVVSDQLGLAKGFGLVVDYVVPDGPAAAAGVQQNDILKMLNDQILLEPGQLRKLLQTFPEGTTVTLTVLRKGQEQKVSVKLVKKEMPNRHAFMPGHDGNLDFNFDGNFGNVDLGDLKERLQDLKQDLREQAGERRNMIHDAVMKANEEVRRARDEARDAMGNVKVYSKDGNALKSTRIDVGKAQIVFSDDKGEMKIEPVDGKKVLTAKDPQGKLLFSGPVETKEDLDKVPADVRLRFNKLQERDIPSVTSSDENDNDEDSDMNDEDDNGASTEQVSNDASAPLSHVIQL